MAMVLCIHNPADSHAIHIYVMNYLKCAQLKRKSGRKDGDYCECVATKGNEVLEVLEKAKDENIGHSNVELITQMQKLAQVRNKGLT
ncbi:hypothetical protein SUGI_1123230 [Cryptomeria japonica]|nr:hypothetical protein SUGI_1123230 [Cryptomeria japonica]